jgi:hypothetical protein
VLIARICEVFLLWCTLCGEQMRIIAFITYSADIGRKQAQRLRLLLDRRVDNRSS